MILMMIIIANYYFKGPISFGLKYLFVDRENQKDKKKF